MASNFATLVLCTFLLLYTSPSIFHHTFATPLPSRKPHFVLVHGFGHGAWCWYKVTTLLEASGSLVTAIDLTSNGNSKVVADNVTSVAQFTAPLINFLNATSDKVILVGHSMGGSSISIAMEVFPEKISKAVFLAAFMPSNGQLFLLQEELAAALKFRILVPVFANGPSATPTSIYINLTSAHGVFYNESPLEDVTLAYASINPQPGAPLFESVNLTSMNYGRVQRIYITTALDNATPPSSQREIIANNPPKSVVPLNTDHSPFFSNPVALTNILVSIAAG